MRRLFNFKHILERKLSSGAIRNVTFKYTILSVIREENEWKYFCYN